MAYEVFISYSHQDRALRGELDTHLANLKRQNIITSWSDGDIKPGEEWNQKIMQYLNSAQIILLLISADFMASDFCYSIEMTQAIARHDANQARVIPIILRPVDWQGAPFEKIQVLPTGGKPVTDWLNRDNAFLDIVQGIRRAINDLVIKSNITIQESPWNIPYERNLLFTGRENVLERLYEVLNTSKTAALSGLGGIGKTQIAVEYACRNRDEYDAILWVKAESLDSINTDFESIAPLLNLPEKEEQKQHLIVEAVKRWFKDHPGWLLIFDNADDLEMVRNFLPSGGKGHILLTTRAHATGRIAQLIKVEKMRPDEGALFLLYRAKLLDSQALLKAANESDQDTARKIVQAMDGLPLALDQAGAYIEATGCGLQEYLTLYQAQGALLLKDRGGLVTDHPEPVATTWLLSFRKLDEANKAAAELLRFCAFLAPDAIPEELFAENVTALGSKLESSVTYISQFNDAIRELHKHSLVQRDPKSKTLTIHRLVQMVLKDQMDVETQRLWAERTVRAVSRVFPYPEYTNWDFCNRLFMHAQMCSVHIEQWKLLISEAATLLNNLGFYLLQRGDYQQVELLHQRALTIHEQLLGTDHPETATSLSHLAYFYKGQGKHEKAEPFYQRALAICGRVQLSDDPDTVKSLNNLAGLHYNQGRLEDAEQLLLRALVICERVLEPDHLDTATSLNGLALVYDRQGKYGQAELQYQRVLAILEQVYGVDHPDTATSLYNLASFYERQGKYGEAGPLFQRALAIRERVLGPDHPETVETRENYESLKERMNEENT